MKKLDKKLHHSEEATTLIAREKALSDALFLNIGEGAIATDSRGRIIRVNPKALEILGFEKEDLIGKWFPVTIIATDERGVVIPTIERSITQSFILGQAVTSRCFYIKKDGSRVAIALTISPIILDDKPVGAVEVFRDITEELEVDRMKSEFISLASHQLRTPATAVKNYIAMLRDGYGGELNQQQYDFAQMAYQSNERQLDIVNDLLFVATTDARSLVLKKKKTDLQYLVQEVIDQHMKTIQRQEHQLEVSLPDKPVFYEVDPSCFKMVIDNLLSNASKYTPQRGKLTVRLRDLKNTVSLSVSDTGVGIEEAHFDKLFKKFSRVDNPLSSAAGGSGIGLYLLKQIVELHDGSVGLKSIEGKGTTFTVTLPKSKALVHTAS